LKINILASLTPDPHHYVCPEDVLYLTYPMNFNVTPKIIRNDAETFIPITCKENAGMTGPIHAIVWLMLNESLKAEGEFNRSLQACTYGEFHVRNEVCLFLIESSWNCLSVRLF